MFRLLPKEDKYFDLFNRVASNISGSAKLLQQLFDDFGQRAAYAEQIKKLEHVLRDVNPPSSGSKCHGCGVWGMNGRPQYSCRRSFVFDLPY